MGFIIPSKDGLEQLRLDTDRPWPGERQGRRGGEPWEAALSAPGRVRVVAMKCQEVKDPD